MNRNALGVAVLTALIAFSLSCRSTSPTSSTPGKLASMTSSTGLE